MKRITLVILFAGLMFMSCSSSKEAAVLSFFGDTYFVSEKRTLLLSTYRFMATDKQEKTLDKDSCIISGKIFHRTPKKRYSGSVMGESDLLEPEGWPHVYVPSLHLDTIVQQGYFELHVPSGYYEIVVYASGYAPVCFKVDYWGQYKYNLEFYLAPQTI